MAHRLKIIRYFLVLMLMAQTSERIYTVLSKA